MYLCRGVRDALCNFSLSTAVSNLNFNFSVYLNLYLFSFNNFHGHYKMLQRVKENVVKHKILVLDS